MKGLGDFGEAVTARYLRKKGYTLRSSQWRCRFGEIDIVAEKAGVLCIVEVKLRSNLSRGLPREAVDGRKQRKLRTAAACYVSTYELDLPVRFDVAEVYTDGKGGVTGFQYIEDAFTCD